MNPSSPAAPAAAPLPKVPLAPWPSLAPERPRTWERGGKGRSLPRFEGSAALAPWLQRLRAHDPATEAHARRVAFWAVRLGQALGLPQADLHLLHWAGLLHDLGKIRVPRAVLHRRGRLTPAEWQMIRQHPRWGYEIAGAIPSLPPKVREAILHHHERWDGRGYPAGLKGKALPPLARILAVADAWDAMRSPRPYRPALSLEQARDQLIQGAGKQWDPVLISRFLTCLPASSKPL